MTVNTEINGTTTIDLLRHGELEGGDIFCGSSDAILSDVGWNQMLDALDGRDGWDIIVSSTSEQCCEFSESIASDDEINLVLHEQFREIHFGDWEGRTPDDVLESDADLLHQWWQAPTRFSPPHGEPFHSFRARVLNAFDSLLKKYSNEHILLISHSTVIRVILTHILGMPDENLYRINVDYGSFSRIQVHHEPANHWATLIEHGSR